MKNENIGLSPNEVLSYDEYKKKLNNGDLVEIERLGRWHLDLTIRCFRIEENGKKKIVYVEWI